MEDIYTNTRPFCLMEPSIRDELLIHHLKMKRDVSYLSTSGEWKKFEPSNTRFFENGVYRAVKTPVKKKKKQVFCNPILINRYWNSKERFPVHTHKITYNIIDGEVDCSSIKMEKL